MIKTEFSPDECRKFISFSGRYYSTNEVTNYNHVKWKFLGYRSNQSYSLVVKDQSNEEVIGRVVLSTRKLNINGAQRVITQVTDLLVDKAAASMLTFIELIKSYSALNSECVIHTSNENSEKIYSSFFKFKEIFELSAFAFPIHPQSLIPFFKRYIFGQYLAKLYIILLNFVFKCIHQVNPIRILDELPLGEIGPILKLFSNRETSLNRSEEFLTWRYLDAPYVYKSYAVYFRAKRIGILAARLTQFQGARFFLVMDYISSSQIGAWEGFGLRLALISEAIAQNADAIFGLFNRNNRDLATFFRPPFLAVNDKMLPHRSPIFASSLTPSLKAEELERMYFSLGDLDYF